MAIELNVRKGMSAAEARREALRSFGGVERTKEMCRDQRRLPMIETAWQDLRFGFRMLRRRQDEAIELYKEVNVLDSRCVRGATPAWGASFTVPEDVRKPMLCCKKHWN
jgi:hypothetical protein